MFGEVFECSHCHFHFSSGWSHHECGQSLICLGCGTRFQAHNPETMWGPDPSKLLNLRKQVYRKKTRSYEWHDTGISLQPGKTLKPGTKGKLFFYFLHKALASLSCPACAQKNSVVETIAGEPPCPKCKTGQMKYAGECIF